MHNVLLKPLYSTMDVDKIITYTNLLFKQAKVLAPGESVYSEEHLKSVAQEILTAIPGKNRIQWSNKIPEYLKRIVDGAKLTPQEADWFWFEWKQSYHENLPALTPKVKSLINAFL